jgi:hypothetical protein
MASATPELTLAEVWAYARCPFRYFWRYQARIAPPPTARGLMEKTVRLATALHYDDSERIPAAEPDQSGLVGCLLAAWRATLEDWGLGDATWALLKAYADRRAQGEEPFLDAGVNKPDGSSHEVPGLDGQDEMSAGYELRTQRGGLPELAQQLGERLSRVPVRTSDECGVLEAFAQSMAMIERNRWPARDMVEGVGCPYQVDLIGDRALKATADMVIGAGDGAVIIEVHDYERPNIPPADLLRRDLRAVAAARASSPAWTSVQGVLYRHVPSGTTVSISAAAGTGRLLTALIGAAEGIRHRVYVPRLAVEPRACRSCPYEELCTQDYQDILDTLDPSLLGAAR